jgi:hypothetical protein
MWMLHTSWYSCRPRRHCHNWEAGNKGNINTYTKATKTHNLEQFSNTSNTPQYPTYKEKVTQLGTNKNTVQGRSFQECNTWSYLATPELSQRTHAIWRHLLFGKGNPLSDHGSIQVNNTCWHSVQQTSLNYTVTTVSFCFLNCNWV